MNHSANIPPFKLKQTNMGMVSVIINCFNGEKHLRYAIESVLSQTYMNWELIFWDNCSTDSSCEIFNSYKDPRLKYFKSETKAPLGRARNHAVEKSSGKYIAFLDCDDIWDRNKLSIQVSYFEKNKKVSIVYSQVEFEVADDKSAKKLHNSLLRGKKSPHNARYIYEDMLKGNFIIFSSVLIKREDYLSVGGISEGLSQNEDYDLLLKLSLVGTAICSNESLTIYRIHKQNNTHKQQDLSYLENRIIFSSLPPSISLSKAVRINETKFAVHEFCNGNICSGLARFFAGGSFLWLTKRVIQRVFRI